MLSRGFINYQSDFYDLDDNKFVIFKFDFDFIRGKFYSYKHRSTAIDIISTEERFPIEKVTLLLQPTLNLNGEKNPRDS